METRRGRAASAVEAVGARVGRYRWLVISVIWLAMSLVSFDRSAISLLLVDPTFLGEMGLEGSPERQGLLMSALLFCYALSNIFISPAADRWGPRRVLLGMTAVWSGAALFMGSVASYPALMLGRVARGLGEGPVFPISNRFVRYWFPASERGLANAVWTSGQRLGLALSVPILAATIAAWGWRCAFFLQAGLIALLAIPALLLLVADRPELMPRVGEAERRHILGAGSDDGVKQSAGGGNLAGLLRNYRYWLMVIYHFSVLAVYFGLITWLPKYLRDARGFDMTELVFFATLPHLASTVSGLVFGSISDRMGRRAIFCVVGLAGASAIIGFAVLASNPLVSASLMVLGFGIWAMGSPTYYAIMQRIIPGQIIATGIGIDNGLANFGSALAPTLVGILIGTTGSYLAGMLMLVGVGLVGSLAAAVLAIQRY